MNIDRKTPIGKAVPTEIELDARPEVEGHRSFAARHHEDAKDAVLAETGDEENEVEGHRSFAARMHDVPEDGDEDEQSDVQGHMWSVR